jgi:hypothetical protein
MIWQAENKAKGKVQKAKGKIAIARWFSSSLGQTGLSVPQP